MLQLHPCTCQPGPDRQAEPPGFGPASLPWTPLAIARLWLMLVPILGPYPGLTILLLGLNSDMPHRHRPVQQSILLTVSGFHHKTWCFHHAWILWDCSPPSLRSLPLAVAIKFSSLLSFPWGSACRCCSLAEIPNCSIFPKCYSKQFMTNLLSLSTYNIPPWANIHLRKRSTTLQLVLAALLHPIQQFGSSPQLCWQLFWSCAMNLTT